MLLNGLLALSIPVVCGQVSSSDRVTSSTSVETCNATPHTSNRHNSTMVQGHSPPNARRHVRKRQEHRAPFSSAAHKHQARANAVVNTILTNWCCLQLHPFWHPACSATAADSRSSPSSNLQCTTKATRRCFAEWPAGTQGRGLPQHTHTRCVQGAA